MLELKTSSPKSTEPAKKRRNVSAQLIARMALQNLLRRPTRTFMLIFAVALGTGAVFASFTVARGIQASMEQSFERMGADLIVVPENTMVNITSALLTVQPTDETLDSKIIDQIAHTSGVARVAPQTIYRVPFMAGMPGHKVNLIAFDPARDFTVQPWLKEHLPREMQSGDLLAGGRRTEELNDEVSPGGNPATVYGKLGRSGVGPFDESFFATYDTVAELAAKDNSGRSGIPTFNRKRVSALLVKLDFGATPEQVRFGIAKLPGIKVITGATIVTATRQTMTALLSGMAGFAALMLVGALILLSLVFSAIIAERRREIGLFRAIGMRGGDIVRMLVTEATFATIIGGLSGLVLGCLLLLLFQRSLVYYLETLHVAFAWPPVTEIAAVGLSCAVVAGLVGMLGAALPAWKTSRAEAQALIQGEGG